MYENENLSLQIESAIIDKVFLISSEWTSIHTIIALIFLIRKDNYIYVEEKIHELIGLGMRPMSPNLSLLRFKLISPNIRGWMKNTEENSTKSVGPMRTVH